MNKSLLAVVFLAGCTGGGDDRTNFTFESQCITGDNTVSCSDLEFGEGARASEEANGSLDPNITCTDTGSITIVCGPSIELDTAIANGSRPELSDFLARGKRERDPLSDFSPDNL